MTNELAEQTITLKELAGIVQALRATMRDADKDAFRSGVMAALALVGEHASLLAKEKAMGQPAERTQVLADPVASTIADHVAAESNTPESAASIYINPNPISD